MSTTARTRTPARWPTLVAKAADELVPATSGSYLRRNFGACIEVLRGFPVARTRPFDAIERGNPGQRRSVLGDHRSLEVHRLSGMRRRVWSRRTDRLRPDPRVEEKLESGFEFLSRTPNTPARFTAGAVDPGGDTKRLFLDRANYYAVTGGHGGCRGCGEVTSTRMVMAASHALGAKRQSEQRIC